MHETRQQKRKIVTKSGTINAHKSDFFISNRVSRSGGGGGPSMTKIGYRHSIHSDQMNVVSIIHLSFTN